MTQPRLPNDPGAPGEAQGPYGTVATPSPGMIGTDGVGIGPLPPSVGAEEAQRAAQRDQEDRLAFWYAFHEAGGAISAKEWIALPPLDQAACKMTAAMWREHQTHQFVAALRAAFPILAQQSPPPPDPLKVAAQQALRETR